MPEDERVPLWLYTEEAQNFIGDFPSILQEARKYRLTLVLATQGIEQLSKESAFAVFTNCATLVSFRVSSTDAARLKEEFSWCSPPAICKISRLQDVCPHAIAVRQCRITFRTASRSALSPVPKTKAAMPIVKTLSKQATTVTRLHDHPWTRSWLASY